MLHFRWSSLWILIVRLLRQPKVLGKRLVSSVIRLEEFILVLKKIELGHLEYFLMVEFFVHVAPRLRP